MLLALWVLTLAPLVDDGAAEGLAALRALEEKHRDLLFLSADYVQERTTPLMRRPLISAGRIAFRRSPGCLVFHTTKPRETVMRLDPKSYQVHRPHRKQLEKFLLEDQRWQKALFQTLSHQVREIEKDFEVVGSAVEEHERDGKKETLRRVTLKPKAEKIARRIRQLEIGIREAEALVTHIAYVDAQGDRIAITLKKIDQKTELPAARFELKVPEGTQVIVHEAEEGGRP